MFASVWTSELPVKFCVPARYVIVWFKEAMSIRMYTCHLVSHCPQFRFPLQYLPLSVFTQYFSTSVSYFILLLPLRIQGRNASSAMKFSLIFLRWREIGSMKFCLLPARLMHFSTSSQLVTISSCVLFFCSIKWRKSRADLGELWVS